MRTEYGHHTLKMWPESFEALWVGAKAFDIRLDDRAFEVGDTIDFHEYNPTTKTFTGRQMRRRITHLSCWNQKPNHVVMGLAA